MSLASWWVNVIAYEAPTSSCTLELFNLGDGFIYHAVSLKMVTSRSAIEDKGVAN